MAERRHGAAGPITETTVRSTEWDGQDQIGQTHERVAFIDVDMTELLNEGSTFTECVFRGVRFNASTHTDAAFLNCTFPAAPSSTPPSPAAS